MELIGDEKRIRALFSDLRVNDERMVPEFNVLVNRAPATTARPRALNLRFAWAAVLVCAITGLASWGALQRQQPAAPPVTSTPPRILNNGVSKTTEPVIATLRSRNASGRNVSRLRNAQLLARRLAARRHAEMLAANQRILENATAISKWESPTGSLLSSSSGEVLTTLPQLNQSYSQLKSFLPNSSN